MEGKFDPGAGVLILDDDAITADLLCESYGYQKVSAFRAVDTAIAGLVRQPLQVIDALRASGLESQELALVYVVGDPSYRDWMVNARGHDASSPRSVQYHRYHYGQLWAPRFRGNLWVESMWSEVLLDHPSRKVVVGDLRHSKDLGEYRFLRKSSRADGRPVCFVKDARIERTSTGERVALPEYLADILVLGSSDSAQKIAANMAREADKVFKSYPT